ncbi:MAG: hypothetical protein LBU81_03110 [Methanosarcinales archaeon]|nr:hypothetical protein [Methanosarcinales archaeon]
MDEVWKLLSRKLFELKNTDESLQQIQKIRKQEVDELIQIFQENKLERFEDHGIEIIYEPPSMEMRLDRKRLRHDLPAVVTAYSVPVPVKEKLVLSKKENESK